MGQAILWEPLSPQDPRVRCNLCAHHCVVSPGMRGVCGVRENRDGALYTLVRGRAIAHHVDPIEKKPLFHFLPGTRTFSVATAGCNLRCAFCQNWEISQMAREARGAIPGQPLNPREIVQMAQQAGCRSIAYTYTEPTIFAEYALETGTLAHSRGLKNVWVSNGYMSPELLCEMTGVVDGINVDLKAGRGEFYRKISGASLKPILENLKLIQHMGIWLEITTLVIPGLNDSDAELNCVAKFIRDELGPHVPWHISRFYPNYRMRDILPTPTSTLEMAWQIGRDAGLHYVYLGNVPGHQTESTFCPNCDAVAIERQSYRVGHRNLRKGKCASCGARVDGVEMD